MVLPHAKHFSETRKFIYVNFCGNPDDEKYHNRFILLDPADRLSPFPAIFLVHECRVRARWPFLSDCDSDVSEQGEWPDWLTASVGPDGVPIRNNLPGYFPQDGPNASTIEANTLGNPSEGGNVGRFSSHHLTGPCLSEWLLFLSSCRLGTAASSRAPLGKALQRTI